MGGVEGLKLTMHPSSNLVPTTRKMHRRGLKTIGELNAKEFRLAELRTVYSDTFAIISATSLSVGCKAALQILKINAQDFEADLHQKDKNELSGVVTGAYNLEEANRVKRGLPGSYGHEMAISKDLLNAFIRYQKNEKDWESFALFWAKHLELKSYLEELFNISTNEEDLVALGKMMREQIREVKVSALAESAASTVSAAPAASSAPAAQSAPGSSKGNGFPLNIVDALVNCLSPASTKY